MQEVLDEIIENELKSQQDPLLKEALHDRFPERPVLIELGSFICKQLERLCLLGIVGGLVYGFFYVNKA